jgi:hypothetical protein
MAVKRNRAPASAPITSVFIPGSCDAFAARDITPKGQREIAVIAFRIWLDRAFKDGSPQEDWIKAQRQVQRRQTRVSVKSAGAAAF